MLLISNSIVLFSDVLKIIGNIILNGNQLKSNKNK